MQKANLRERTVEILKENDLDDLQVLQLNLNNLKAVGISLGESTKINKCLEEQGKLKLLKMFFF